LVTWSHTKVNIGKVKDANEALFYFQKTVENAWNRDVLALQMKSDLYKRAGKSITNFATTHPHNGLAPSSYWPCTAHNKKPARRLVQVFCENS
jgi:predicted nuclease of restriction endonuclease-like (RecB) superfamily